LLATLASQPKIFSSSCALDSTTPGLAISGLTLLAGSLAVIRVRSKK